MTRWGSLRLAPIISQVSHMLYVYIYVNVLIAKKIIQAKD